jgi:hypothetical protein
LTRTSERWPGRVRSSTRRTLTPHAESGQLGRSLTQRTLAPGPGGLEVCRTSAQVQLVRSLTSERWRRVWRVQRLTRERGSQLAFDHRRGERRRPNVVPGPVRSSTPERWPGPVRSSTPEPFALGSVRRASRRSVEQ